MISTNSPRLSVSRFRSATITYSGAQAALFEHIMGRKGTLPYDVSACVEIKRGVFILIIRCDSTHKHILADSGRTVGRCFVNELDY